MASITKGAITTHFNSLFLIKIYLKYVNLKELSTADIIELLKEEHFDKDLIIEALNRQSLSLNHILNKVAKENDDVRTICENHLEYPQTGEVIFYPNKDTFEESTLANRAIIHIPEHKKRAYQSIDSDSGFCLKVRVVKVNDSLLEYKLVESEKKITDYLKNSIIGNVAAISAALVLSVTAVNLVNEEPQLTKSKAISLIQDVSFFENYTYLMSELESVGMKTHNLQLLTNHDIKLVLSLNSEQEDDIDDLIVSDDDIINSIADVVSPYVKDKSKVEKIANAILETSKERKVDYLLFLSIMKVETTTFNQNAISSTGDVSIAQIKPEVWTKEFERLGREPLDVKRLKSDSSYAIDRMGEILEIQNKYRKKDPVWYARYHSKTPEYKNAYAAKVQKEYVKIRNTQLDDLESRIDVVLETIQKIKTDLDNNNLPFNTARLENFQNEIIKLKNIIDKNREKGLKKLVAKL